MITFSLFSGSVRMNKFFNNPEFIINGVKEINIDELIKSIGEKNAETWKNFDLLYYSRFLFHVPHVSWFGFWHLRKTAVVFQRDAFCRRCNPRFYIFSAAELFEQGKIFYFRQIYEICFHDFSYRTVWNFLGILRIHNRKCLWLELEHDLQRHDLGFVCWFVRRNNCEFVVFDEEELRIQNPYTPQIVKFINLWV